MGSLPAERPAILGGTAVRPAGPPSWPRHDLEIRSTFLEMIDSGDWGRYHGPHVPSLCRRLAEYHGLEHVHPCSSGTAAVELALRGLGITADDEVILAGYDFKANFQNILCLRAIPVLVDIDRTTFQLDPDKLVAAISHRTKAILITHLHGGCVDAPVVRRIADAHGLTVLEDICQSPGAHLHGQRAGTWGDVSVLSFGGSKLLTAGRGGAVLTARTDIWERIRRYVHRGNDAYPLSEAQAAILFPQISQLDHLNAIRCDSVNYLGSQLASVAGPTILQLPTKDWSPAYYKVGLRYRADDFSGLPRSFFVESLRAEGIAFDVGFRGLHLIHGSRRYRAAGELLQADHADAEMLTLHHPVLLEGGSAVDEIMAAIEKVREWASEIYSERLGSGDLVGDSQGDF